MKRIITTLSVIFILANGCGFTDQKSGTARPDGQHQMPAETLAAPVQPARSTFLEQEQVTVSGDLQKQVFERVQLDFKIGRGSHDQILVEVSLLGNDISLITIFRCGA